MCNHTRIQSMLMNTGDAFAVCGAISDARVGIFRCARKTLNLRFNRIWAQPNHSHTLPNDNLTGEKIAKYEEKKQSINELN